MMPCCWSRSVIVSKTASFLVALAGPLSNFVAAGLIAIPIQVGWVPYINPISSFTQFLQFRVQTTEDYIGLFLTGAVYLNCILGLFNLIPIPPLDGFKVALFVLPDDIAREFAKLDQYGFAILLVVLFGIPFLTGYSPLADFMGPSVRWLVHLFTGAG
jgi:Zn-dependent protease